MSKLMSKPRANSTWNKLTAEQREKLEDWLFEEGLSYREVMQRAPRELGVVCSKSGLSRFYKRTLNKRAVAELGESQQAAKAVEGTGVKLEKLRSSALTLIGSRLLDKAMAGGDVNELAALGKLLSDGEKREIQRKRLDLARQRFQFNAAEAALAELPHVEGLTEEDMKQEKARVRAIIRRLFGTSLPE